MNEFVTAALALEALDNSAGAKALADQLRRLALLYVSPVPPSASDDADATDILILAEARLEQLGFSL